MEEFSGDIGLWDATFDILDAGNFTDWVCNRPCSTIYARADIYASLLGTKSSRSAMRAILNQDCEFPTKEFVKRLHANIKQCLNFVAVISITLA